MIFTSFQAGLLTCVCLYVCLLLSLQQILSEQWRCGDVENKMMKKKEEDVDRTDQQQQQSASHESVTVGGARCERMCVYANWSG